MERQWVSFDECFDTSDGGALYVCTVAPATFQAAGALWMDGGVDGMHYFAFAAEFEEGFERDGVVVTDMFSAADAFPLSYDGDVADEIGWFGTMEEAVEAVNGFCGC